MKYGGEVIFRSNYSRSGYVVGELRICQSCEAKSFINGMEIVGALPDELEVIEDYLEEYTPRFTNDGESICQFCNQVETD